MLKVKDNVDLKELEKFGFTSLKNNYYKKDISFRYVYSTDKETISILISSQREIRKVKLVTCYGYTYLSKKIRLFKKDIKDLIQAGLVEKV